MRRTPLILPKKGSSRRARVLRRDRRRGMGIIAVLAVFAVVVAMSGIWMKAELRRHYDQQLRELQIQSQWLAEAGVRRGAARWVVDPKYQGETWQIPAAEIDRPTDARVVIRVEPSAQNASTVRIVAAAAYPGGGPHVVVSKAVNFTRKSPDSLP